MMAFLTHLIPLSIPKDLIHLMLILHHENQVFYYFITSIHTINYALLVIIYDTWALLLFKNILAYLY